MIAHYLRFKRKAIWITTNLQETEMTAQSLFEPLRLGAVELAHRVVMAPLTRLRSLQPGDIPHALNAEYYGQRASEGGLIITEATDISPHGRGACQRRNHLSANLAHRPGFTLLDAAQQPAPGGAFRCPGDGNESYGRYWCAR